MTGCSLEEAQEIAKVLAADSGETVIVYELDDMPGMYLARAMSRFMEVGAPQAAREVGRAGLDAVGKPFWSTLQ